MWVKSRHVAFGWWRFKLFVWYSCCTSSTPCRACKCWSPRDTVLTDRYATEVGSLQEQADNSRIPMAKSLWTLPQERSRYEAFEATTTAKTRSSCGGRKRQRLCATLCSWRWRVGLLGATLTAGYYDGVIFHRIVKGFIVQTGDPTGTGMGGESIYGEPFEDEIHSRLRFNRRGLIGMANNSKRHTNGSQWFITLDRADELSGKHTLFGRINGPTYYSKLI